MRTISSNLARKTAAAHHGAKENHPLWLKRVLKYVNAKLIRQLVLSKSTFNFLYSHMIQPFFAGYKHYVRKVPLS